MTDGLRIFVTRLRAHKPGVLKCWELATGKLLFSERLPGLSQLASPFATPDGRVYFVSGGKSFVIEAGPKLKVLATNSLEGLTGDDGLDTEETFGRSFAIAAVSIRNRRLQREVLALFGPLFPDRPLR